MTYTCGWLSHLCPAVGKRFRKGGTAFAEAMAVEDGRMVRVGAGNKILTMINADSALCEAFDFPKLHSTTLTF